jgi:hypothetical protein
MANRFWTTTGTTGGVGNWSNVQNWASTTGGAAGASVPGSADTATFDANSGSGIATLDISPTIQTLTCTGFTGTLAFGTNTITLNSTGTVFVGATTMSVSGTPLIILSNATTTATRTINATAVTEANSISFNITAGSGTAVITVTGGGAVRNLNFTGFTGSHNATSYTMYGSLTLGTGMTVTAGSTTTFAATSGTKTITTNGVTFDKSITFNGAGGTFQLVGALTSGATRNITLTAGTLDLNGNSITAGTLSSSGALTRSIIFRLYESITLAAIGNVTVYTASDSTNFTVVYSGLPNDNYVNISGVGVFGNTRTITPGLTTSGGSEANALNFSIPAGADTINLGTANRVYKSIVFDPVFTGNLAANVAPYIYGGFFILSPNMTVTGGTNNWVFKSTTIPTLFDTENLSLDTPITVNGVGGVTMLYALNIGSKALTLISGTLSLYRGVTNYVQLRVHNPLLVPQAVSTR